MSKRMTSNANKRNSFRFSFLSSTLTNLYKNRLPFVKWHWYYAEESIEKCRRQLSHTVKRP